MHAATHLGGPPTGAPPQHACLDSLEKRQVNPCIEEGRPVRRDRRPQDRSRKVGPHEVRRIHQIPAM